MSVVLPDRAGEPDTTSARPRTVLAVVGTAVLVAGFGVLGALTSPEPEIGVTTTSAQEPEPTFDLEEFVVADIVRGPDLDWEKTLVVEDRFVNGLVSHLGATLLYASELPWWRSGEGTTAAWSSGSGFDWRSHGEVIEGAGGSGPTSNGRALVAVSSGWNAPSLLLTSADGINWKSEIVPIDVPEGHSLSLTQGAVSGQSRVVVGTSSLNVQARLRRHLAEKHGIDLTEFHWQSDATDDDIVYTIQGPLGLPILEVRGEDLGLDEAGLAAANGGSEGDPSGLAWANFNDEGWVRAELADLRWLDTILVAPDGSLVAHGWTDRGNTFWRSFDGREWVIEDVDGLAPEAIVRWREGLAGARLFGLPSLLTSQNGYSWERTSLEGLLPTAMRWGFEHLDGGEAGVGLVASSWDALRGGGEREPLLVRRDKITFVFALSEGRVRMLTDDGEQVFPLYSSTPDWVRPDLATQTVAFFHEETGEPLARLTFEELRQAEDDYWSAPEAGLLHQALLFSPDGADWWVDDFQADIGREVQVLDIAMSADSVVIAVTDSRPFRLTQPAGFEIWAAKLP